MEPRRRAASALNSTDFCADALSRVLHLDIRRLTRHPRFRAQYSPRTIIIDVRRAEVVRIRSVAAPSRRAFRHSRIASLDTSTLEISKRPLSALPALGSARECGKSATLACSPLFSRVASLPFHPRRRSPPAITNFPRGRQRTAQLFTIAPNRGTVRCKPDSNPTPPPPRR